MSDFEAELIHHAAPTLLGRKQSNLFSLPLSLLPKCREEIALYGKKLAEKGICIVYLYSFKNRVFIMVYRQNAMMRYLRVPHVRDYLISLGYPARIGKKDAMTETLAHLRKRMQADGEQHCADAVDRKPRPVEEAAVGKGFVPIQKDGNLPEKPADRAEKEEINLLGEEKRYRSLLRCAEFGKIRKTVMFFHGHSITGTLKIIEL